MMQRYNCGPNQLSGKLMAMWTDREMGMYTQSLFVYGRIVSSIPGIDEDDDDDLVLNELLLSSVRKSSITYNENDIITVFSHSRE